MRNLIFAYDLIAPGQNYEAVTSKICSLGPWYKLQYSLFYVQADLSPQQAYDLVRVVMDPNDKLFVANAAEAFVGNYPIDHLNALQSSWGAAA